MKSLLRPVFTIVFSGHRPDSRKGGRSSSQLEGLVAPLTEIFTDFRSRVGEVGGEVHLVCSLAAGADIVACEVARTLEIPIHLVLPKPTEQFLEEDFDGEAMEWKARAESMIAHLASGDHQPSEWPRRSTSREMNGPYRSPDCYLRTNAFMLEVGDFVVAAWNGVDEAKTGGTGHTVQQARVLERPIVVVDPASNEMNRSGDDFDPNEADGVEVFKGFEDHLTCLGDNRATLFEEVAACLEDSADQSSAKFRGSTKKAIILHAAAGFLAAIAASFYALLKSDFYGASYVMLAVFSLVELFMVGRGCYLEKQVEKSHVQHTWLDCRMGREIMRGLEEGIPFLDPLVPEIKRGQPKWERFGMTSALLRRSSQPILDEGARAEVIAARDRYIKGRIDDQIEHFQKEKAKALQMSVGFKRMAHLSGPIAFWVVMVACLVKLTLVFTHGEGWSGILTNSWLNAGVFLFLPILFPLLASLSAFFFVWFDFGRRANRYGEMIDALEKKKKWIKTLEHASVIAPAIRRTERLLLDENIEWVAAQKAGLGH